MHGGVCINPDGGSGGGMVRGVTVGVLVAGVGVGVGMSGGASAGSVWVCSVGPRCRCGIGVRACRMSMLWGVGGMTRMSLLGVWMVRM